MRRHSERKLETAVGDFFPNYLWLGVGSYCYLLLLITITITFFVIVINNKQVTRVVTTRLTLD